MQNAVAVTLDFSYLHSVSDSDKAFEKALLKQAIISIQSMMEELQQAWQQHDAPGIRNTAHSLKPVITIAGLPQLESYCKAIDFAFKDGRFHADQLVNMNEIILVWEAALPQLELLTAD